MKKLLSLAAVVFLVGSTLAWGIEPIAVENGSFELPGLEEYTCWDGEDEGTVDVPGWTSDSNPAGSGVEMGWNATDGIWSAFLLGGDPSVWQVTDHVIAANETIRFQVDVKNIWSAAPPATLQMTLFAYDEIVDPNDPNIITAVRTPIRVYDAVLGDAMQTCTMECVAADVPEAVGYKLGIELGNSTADLSYIGMDNVKLASIVSTGVNIIWVTEALDLDLDGVQDDQQWIDWLVDEGHTVDNRPNYWMTFDPIDPNDANEVPKIDQLNAADLVLISRLTNSGNYNQSGEIATWNSVRTPVLMLTGYLARSSRWKWVNSGTLTNIDTPLIETLQLDHPIFDGVTIEQLNIVDPNDLIDPNDPNAPIVLPDPIYGIDALDASVGAGQTSFIGSLNMGNGTLIAKAYENSIAAIAEWVSGVEYYAGAGQITGDHRLLFCAGTNNVGATPQGKWNLTAEGEKMFRNAIAYMLYQPLPARELKPASGTTDVALDGTLTWRPGKLATMYNVYLSTDKDAVANGTALIDSVAGNSYNLAPLSLILSTTYYWRIDAVDGDQVWPGEVVNLRTVDFIAVDDFESYAADTIGSTWVNGLRKYGANAYIPYRTAPEVNEVTVHSGAQSMALPYDNSNNPFFIDVARVWSPQNWTKAGAKTLVIYFHGDPGNAAEKVWVRINGYRVDYNGGGLTNAGWTQWNISLSSLRIDTTRIVNLDFGVGNAAVPPGSKGIVYLDDVRLYRVTP